MTNDLRRRRLIVVALSAALLGVAAAFFLSRDPAPSAPARAADGPAAMVVAIDGTSDVVLRGEGAASLAVGRLGRDDPARARTTLAALEDALAARADAPPGREPDGTSRRLVVVEAQRSTPWTLVQWVLSTATGSRVRAGSVRVDVAGEPEGPVLVVPRSELGAGHGVRRFVRATLAPARPGLGPRLTVVVGEATWEADLEDERVAVRDELPDPAALPGWFAAHGALVRGRVGEVETPSPAGAELPSGDVARVLRALAAAGVGGVELAGAPEPFPWKR